MFDFLFQALYSFYERREKGGDSVWTASLYVSVIEFMILCSFTIMLDIISNGIVSMNGLNVNKDIQKVVFLIAGVVIYTLNMRRFRNKKDIIVAKYNNHPANKWFRVWMLAVLMFLLVLSPILWNELHKLIIK